MGILEWEGEREGMRWRKGGDSTGIGGFVIG